MSDTYTKLFSSITESTVWGEPYSTRIVWVAMLAMADAHGRVYGSIPGLARRANVTLPEAEAALVSFSSPDPYSRTPDNDGRRIEAIDGGWLLLNFGKYKALRDAEERRAYKRQWDRDNRGSRSDKSDKTRQPPTNPTDPTPPTPTPTPEDQKQGARSTKKPSKRQVAAEYPLPPFIDREAWRRWIEVRKHPEAGLDLNVQKLTGWHAEGFDPNAILLESAAQGWQGLFRPKYHPNGAPHDHHRSDGGRPSLAERAARNERRVLDRHASDARGEHGEALAPDD